METEIIICDQCGKSYKYNRSNRKGCNKKKCANCVMKNHRTQYKDRAIEYKGGKCIICGYNKCRSALEFHHTNPKEKDFSISHKGETRGWDNIRKELDKCILVCSNCHREIHSELT